MPMHRKYILLSDSYCVASRHSNKDLPVREVFTRYIHFAFSNDFDHTLRRQTQSSDNMQHHHFRRLYLLLLIQRSEIWTLREKERKRLTSIETKCFCRTARYTLFDRKTNEEILEELKVEPVDDKLEDTNQIGYDM